MSEKPSHREVAEGMASFLSDGPADVRNDGAVAYATVGQIHASLAIAEQLERLNDNLGNLLGDGSHLDGLKRAAREIPGELNDLGRS